MMAFPFSIFDLDASMKTGLAAILTATILTLAGCSSESAVFPVKGRVVFRDRLPVSGGVIEFAPDSGGPSARARIGADGRFELRTGERLGAVSGNHRIAIIQAVIADGAGAHVRSRHTAKVVHPRFARFETSGLTRIVEPNPDNDFTIEVEAAVEQLGW
jgi:hypothetical protein